MKKHYKEKHSVIFVCGLCPKKFQNEDEVKHHLYLEHRGMSKEQLNRGAAALLTKKQLGDYVKEDGSGASYDCPDCFEMFPDAEKLNDHRKITHNLQLTDEAIQKLKEITDTSQVEAPKCDVCTKPFLGLIVCKMNGKPTGACMNCYENHYGPNRMTS